PARDALGDLPAEGVVCARRALTKPRSPQFRLRGLAFPGAHPAAKPDGASRFSSAIPHAGRPTFVGPYLTDGRSRTSDTVGEANERPCSGAKHESGGGTR